MFSLVSDFQVTAALTSDFGAGRLAISAAPNAVVMTLAPFFIGPEGPRGPAGAAGFVSADSGNKATLGQDGGIFVGAPELETTDW